MKEITDTLSVFFNIFRNDVLEFFQKSYSYLRDLIVYKKIDLNEKIETDNESQVKNNIEKMLKAIKTGLNTIGIPIEQLNKDQKNFLEKFSIEKVQISNYNSYFEIYLQNHVNILLFEILFDYLLNIDEKKLENVNLFDLLPPYFLSKLNEFKRSHFSNKKTVELFKKQNYKSYINFTDLTIIKPMWVAEDNILEQLREAKEGSIETLKTNKREGIKQSFGTIREKENIDKKAVQVNIGTVITQIEHNLNIVLNTNTFLDYIGNCVPIHPKIINKITIDKLNLINLKVVNRDFFDLESLFYYISILKMLNLESPFSPTEILEILKNFVHRWVFSSSIDSVPDSINNFYGLAIFNEMDLLNKTNVIDLQEIENFIIKDLETVIPEKLELNLYSLLCMKLIIKMQKKKLERKLNLEPITHLNLLERLNLKPTLDIFNHLSSLKLLGKEDNINNLKITYTYEIKKLITSNGSIRDLVTESAIALLIFDLLNLKQNEQELCNDLFNFILTKTSFFNTENLNPKFNWRSDLLAFKIELQMLYWALMASAAFISESS
ncbi:MAG: hypothetical protein ACFFA4_10680 [Promethearchaeota archaeon]